MQEYKIPGVGPLSMDKSKLKKGALAGEVAVVTGAAGNVGLGVARSLAWLGARVVIADVNEEPGKAAEELINSESGPASALFVNTDVSDEASMKAMAKKTFDKFGKVDILINNAMAMSLGAPVLTSTVYQLDRMYEIAARGTLIGIQLFVPGMQARHHGVVTYMSTAFCHPIGPSNYCAAKAAGGSIMMSLASELGPVANSGIAVFTFIPAGVGMPRSVPPPTPEMMEEFKKRFKDFKMPAMPGYEANIPSEDCGAAMAYCVIHADELHGSGIMVGQAFRQMDWPFPKPETVQKSDFQRLNDMALPMIFAFMGPGFRDPKVPLSPISRE
ncbi:MAG: SDR family NAD(P)-dependent oxidoreductase [Dehalococcoidales bacterium]|nr:SDR family NAD(P)-dependent oxidoreductase [Dehalococcoidales bacterium]